MELNASAELDAMEWREGRRCGAHRGADLGRRMERVRGRRHGGGSEFVRAGCTTSETGRDAQRRVIRPDGRTSSTKHYR